MCEERKLYNEKARDAAPTELVMLPGEGTEFPEGHTHAIVEVLDDGEHGCLFAYVASGDEDGMAWAWPHAQKTHPRAEQLRIVNLAAALQRSIAMS